MGEIEGGEEGLAVALKSRCLMALQDRQVADVTILDIDGRITIQDGADEFRAVARRLLALSRVRLVLNLQLVPYIDSTALGEIVRLHASVTRRRGGMKLLNVTPRVRELLTTTRLLPVFDLFDDEAEAVKMNSSGLDWPQKFQQSAFRACSASSATPAYGSVRGTGRFYCGGPTRPHRCDAVALLWGVMVWFYKRDRVSLSLETRYDNDTSEYVAVVVHPEGRRETQRFERREAFRAWLQTFEERLANERWATDGPAHVLSDGWPDKPPMM